MADLGTRISDFLWKNLNEKHVTPKKDKFWEALTNTGTELWLDTGSIEGAEACWTAEMNGLTTNNSLLNKEIQNGNYDVFIFEAKAVVRDLPQEERVKEIAFILNARHALRLAQKFGGLVSVELHTDTAHDIKAILSYGRRYHEICPDQFIIKIPFTAEGLIGARLLKDSGAKVNITLGFSARQNVVATRFSRPDYLNVFLGRIGAYMVNNNLGDGTGAGERTVISTQNWVTGLSAENQWQTKLIAASLRDFRQVELLAGTDVLTMPPDIASLARAELKGDFNSRMHENYDVSIFSPSDETGVEKFWEVDEKVLNFAARIALKPPVTGQELISIASEEGCGDIFSRFSKDDIKLLAADGKIPVHKHWEQKIKEGKTAPDTLLNMAGVESFTADQKLLDERIRSIIE